MPTFIVKLKPEATEEHLNALKDQIISQGGTIGHDYNIIKGFSAELPEGTVTALESHEHVDFIEPDGEVTTQ